MIGIIGKKLGMTQIFNEEGQQIPVTVIEAPSRIRSSPSRTRRKPATRRCSSASARRVFVARRSEGEGAPKGHRATLAAVGHAKKAGLEAPPARAALRPARRAGQREAGDPVVQRRRRREGRRLRRRRHGEGHRHDQGPRLSGRREALRNRRRSEHARQHEASPSRLDRTRHGSVARHQGQEDAGPLRRRAAHADSPSRREDRRRAQPDLRPRFGRREAGRNRGRAQAGAKDSHG